MWIDMTTLSELELNGLEFVSYWRSMNLEGETLQIKLAGSIFPKKRSIPNISPKYHDAPMSGLLIKYRRKCSRNFGSSI